MNCLWEVMLKAKEQGVPEKNIRFQVSRAFSPYMEVSCPCLNQDTLEDIPVIEVNPYYRFYSIFKDLCHPEMKEFSQAYYKKLLFQDFINNLYGAPAMEAMGLFNRNEREILLSGLIRQYETGSSLDLFKDMMEGLIQNNIVYRNNDDCHEIMVYIGQKYDKTIAAKMEHLIQLFVEIPYSVEIYYEYHFGIIGMDDTLHIDEIAIC